MGPTIKYMICKTWYDKEKREDVLRKSSKQIGELESEMQFKLSWRFLSPDPDFTIFKLWIILAFHFLNQWDHLLFYHYLGKATTCGERSKKIPLKLQILNQLLDVIGKEFDLMIVEVASDGKWKVYLAVSCRP